jgi:hypothetical protein
LGFTSDLLITFDECNAGPAAGCPAAVAFRWLEYPDTPVGKAGRFNSWVG